MLRRPAPSVRGVPEGSPETKVPTEKARSLAAIISEHGDHIRRFLVVRGAYLDDVDDLLQDVFATAWEKGIPCRSEDARQYLFVAARYILFNHKRKLARHATKADQECVRIADNTTGSLAAPEEMLVRGERSLEVDELLKSLSPTHRKALELVYLDELTHTEAAQRLGVSRKTLHLWKREALVRLRQLVVDDGREI